MKASILLSFFTFWIARLSAAPVHDNSTTNPPGNGHDFDFDSITPSERLVYHRCFGQFECARLLVPLDYLSDDPNSAHASIAIVKLASNSTEFPEYGPSWGGPILLNPGGPGGSGVDTVLAVGPTLQQIVGQQFSLIGFDPRGVNNTRPEFTCFDNDLDRNAWALKTWGHPLGSAGSGEDIGENYIKGKVLSKLCKSGEGSKYVGTASVARDMLAINEASWDLATDGRRKGVQYWGFSYGSVLGITFAKMFPEKIERLVVDGIVDSNDYYAGEWISALLDTETVWDSFFTYCSAAGPLQCAFHTGTRPEHIRKRFQSLLASLRTQPLAYFIPTSSGEGQPELFTYSDLKTLIFQALYSPLRLFPLLAELFVQVENAFSTGYLPGGLSGLRPSLTCLAVDNPVTEAYRSMEGSLAIFCGDARPQTNITLPEFKKRLAKWRAQSELGGDRWAMNMIGCIGWQAQAIEKPPLPFVKAGENETYPGAAPILLIGNTADPVTPLENAYAMAELFPKNATAVVVQEGEGHCSISAPSECMMDVIRDYFKTGMVKHETRCGQQLKPFIDSEAIVIAKRNTIEGRSIYNIQSISEALNRQWKGKRLGL